MTASALCGCENETAEKNEEYSRISLAFAPAALTINTASAVPPGPGCLIGRV
jgi:hypothetical protein